MKNKNVISAIIKFELKWIILKVKYKVSITNKCHIAITHVQQTIQRTGKALGEFSEQVVEATHQKFNTVWQWYKVKNLECIYHGLNFFKAVNHFNSFNIGKLGT